VKRRVRAMQGPRTAATAWAVIQGIEAVQMIRKGQVLGISRHNRHGQAWVFRSLLGAACNADAANPSLFRRCAKMQRFPFECICGHELETEARTGECKSSHRNLWSSGEICATSRLLTARMHERKYCRCRRRGTVNETSHV
jgi:hypothetical protein